MSRFIVNWWPRGAKLRQVQQSQPVHSFDIALSIAQGEAAHARVVTISKEGEGVNAGTFYLDFIVK